MVGLLRTPSRGDSISVVLRKVLPGGRRGSWAIYEFARKRTGGVELSKENLISS